MYLKIEIGLFHIIVWESLFSIQCVHPIDSEIPKIEIGVYRVQKVHWHYCAAVVNQSLAFIKCY